MINFPQYLIENGFKVYRKVYNNNAFNYVDCDFNNEYSTMVSGDIDYRFIKDNIEIIWGLHEPGKPATLISYKLGFNSDDEMNKYVLNTPNEKILNDLCNL